MIPVAVSAKVPGSGTVLEGGSEADASSRGTESTIGPDGASDGGPSPLSAVLSLGPVMSMN
jgi:hypothetical protein